MPQLQPKEKSTDQQPSSLTADLRRMKAIEVAQTENEFHRASAANAAGIKKPPSLKWRRLS